MYMEKINLNTTVVESREQRLGTIIAWDGKASELSEASQYQNGCGSGRGCGLCEVRGPFSQGSVCSEQMVECQAGHIRDAVLIQHSPIGCGLGQVDYNSLYRNGAAMRNLPVENIRVTCTNLIESDMVFGGAARLAQSIQDVYDRYHPSYICQYFMRHRYYWRRYRRSFFGIRREVRNTRNPVALRRIQIEALEHRVRLDSTRHPTPDCTQESEEAGRFGERDQPMGIGCVYPDAC
ncbi:nitrogenase [Bacteroides reticulotermitis JCM 10512]|uniref:Nitrogenase n=1 Tax=Bacteroides reticulotermitis JCM 10512 TaxID=1445607 RepID=W4UPL6_9BACE|nr:nitrogenase [Bacteroides reticulotermitis JCM 10512]